MGIYLDIISVVMTFSLFSSASFALNLPNEPDYGMIGNVGLPIRFNVSQTYGTGQVYMYECKLCHGWPVTCKPNCNNIVNPFGVGRWTPEPDIHS